MREDSKKNRMLWGATRNNINNMVKGVTDGYKTVLEIEGVGFRAAVQGKDLVLQIGFSHEVKYTMPEGITIKAEKANHYLGHRHRSPEGWPSRCRNP